MNVLLIYPKFPDTFWSFAYAFSFIRKKIGFPGANLQLEIFTSLITEWRLSR